MSLNITFVVVLLNITYVVKANLVKNGYQLFTQTIIFLRLIYANNRVFQPYIAIDNGFVVSFTE